MVVGGNKMLIKTKVEKARRKLAELAVQQHIETNMWQTQKDAAFWESALLARAIERQFRKARKSK